MLAHHSIQPTMIVSTPVFTYNYGGGRIEAPCIPVHTSIAVVRWHALFACYMTVALVLTIVALHHYLLYSCCMHDGCHLLSWCAHMACRVRCSSSALSVLCRV